MKIKPKHLTWEKIRALAEEVRRQYVNPVDLLPVPIETIIEFKLGISIIPEFGLYELAGVEAILLGDLKTIIVDSSMYYNKKYLKRIRFTLAHEIGHFYLHNQEIKGYKFNSIDEWVDFRLKIDEIDLDWFEKQANEFAGRFLVPVDVLYGKILAKQDQISDFYEKLPGEDIDDELILAIARIFSDDFMVSAEVLKKRIKSEFDWTDLKAELL